MSEEKVLFTGEKLKELRKKHGLTQKQVAKGLDVSQAKISEWETGRYQSISKAYQKLLEQFFAKYKK
jgi:transcriptional regulator with XRE-family HTH domain